ncbi:MAG: hypothetical protein Q4G30_00100 [Actinomycetaceae bacterium]|nr:hypothetical protein [Actinomycetaceae bacterium]
MYPQQPQYPQGQQPQQPPQQPPPGYYPPGYPGQPGQPAQPGQYPYPPQQPPKNTRTPLIIGISVLGVLVLGLGAALGFVALTPKDKDPDTKASPSGTKTEPPKPGPTETTDGPETGSNLAPGEFTTYAQAMAFLDNNLIPPLDSFNPPDFLVNDTDMLFRTWDGNMVCTISKDDGPYYWPEGENAEWIQKAATDQSDTGRFLPGVACEMLDAPDIKPEDFDHNCDLAFSSGHLTFARTSNQAEFTYGVCRGDISHIGFDAGPESGNPNPNQRFNLHELPSDSYLKNGDFMCFLNPKSTPTPGSGIVCLDEVSKRGFAIDPEDYRELR